MHEQKHLRRLSSIWLKQPIFFITICVTHRKPLLANPASHKILHDEWAGMHRRHGWSVGRYVVMPDHVHFFITPAAATRTALNDAVGKWKEWTAKRVLKACGVRAPLWQPEFFEHLLRSKESMAEKWTYVRDNPVRAGLVPRAEDWSYAGSVDFA